MIVASNNRIIFNLYASNQNTSYTYKFNYHLLIGWRSLYANASRQKFYYKYSHHKIIKFCSQILYLSVHVFETIFTYFIYIILISKTPSSQYS